MKLSKINYKLKNLENNICFVDFVDNLILDRKKKVILDLNFRKVLSMIMYSKFVIMKNNQIIICDLEQFQNFVKFKVKRGAKSILWDVRSNCSNLDK